MEKQLLAQPPEIFAKKPGALWEPLPSLASGFSKLLPREEKGEKNPPQCVMLRLLASSEQ